MQPGDTELRLSLADAVAVRGRVVDAAGDGVPAFTVVALERTGALARRQVAAPTRASSAA